MKRIPSNEPLLLPHPTRRIPSPQHVHDQLLAEVVPVEKNDQGDPLFLEVQVDAWLTARYSVPLWRSGSTVHGHPRNSNGTGVSNIEQIEHREGFVTVAEAQRRYLSGERSRRWWYRMASTGQIAHHRVGDSILFRTADIEKFIADSRRAEPADTPPDPAPLIPVQPAPKRRPGEQPDENGVGFRFFPR